MNNSLRRWWPRFRNRVLPWFGLAFAILLLGIAIYSAWPRAPREQQLKISAGSLTGTRSTIAEMLKDNLVSAGHANLKLELSETDGSSEALKRVNVGELQLALVQGGLHAADYPNVRRVATLHVEPLHLLVSANIYDEVSEHLLALKGKSVNISTPGSGTHELATELLSFLHLKNGEDFEATEFSYAKLMDPQLEELPDAVFTVSSLPSSVATYLIESHGYRLVELPFAESFQLRWFDARKTGSDINRRRVSSTTIPAYAYQADPPRPESNLLTFGTRLELVANTSVSSQTIGELCKTVYETDFGNLTSDPLEPNLLRSESTFVLHPGAKTYIDRLQPVSTGRMIEVTEQLVGIVGAALGGMLFLWQWLKRSRERRRDKEFVGCVQRVVEIENSALRFEQEADMSVDDLEKMQNELGEIKTELINRYRDGYLEGADMLSAFLKHANDASELISRIVLHESKPKHERDQTTIG